MRTMSWIRFLCLSLAFNAVAVEIPVSHQPAEGAAPRDQYHAVVASNGDQYLVVWGDDRAGVRQTYATRVSRDGTVLDPNGFRVASGGMSSPLRVVWGGKSWFVFSNTCGALKLVRVAANGAVLDSPPHAYSYGAICPDVSVASDGQHVVVGYVSGFQSYEKHALFLDSDGGPIADVRLSSSDTDLLMPVIAASGSSFVAVWKDHAVRFNRNGILKTADSVSFDGSANGSMAMASDGTDMLVVRGSQAFRLSADLVAERIGTLPFSYPRSIAWTGSGYVAAGVVPTQQNNRYHEGNINIVRLDGEGQLLAQREVRTEGVGAHPAKGAAVASNGENVLVAWHDPTEAQRGLVIPDSDAFLSVVSLPDLTPAPRKLLSITADAQLRPVTAASGSHLLTVWQEPTGIYARRHRRDARPEGAPIQLTPGATSMDVIFNGSDFIVATTEGVSVVTRRLPATGDLRVLSESRLESLDAGAIALAHGGGVTLVAWLGQGVKAARVAADGSLTDFPLEIVPYELADTAHRVAVSPDDAGVFLVVWGGSTPECFCSPFSPSISGPLRAARVSSNLTLLDRPPIAIARPIIAWDQRGNPADPQFDPTHSLKADHPSVTWNGQEWLVVWNRGVRSAVDGEVREEIRGRRIARDGTLLDGSADDPGVFVARDGFAPTVAWTGSRYLLAWYGGVPTYNASLTDSNLQQLRTTLFDSLGGPFSNERVLGESPAEDPMSIAVSSGFIAIAYSRLGDDQQYGGASRAFLDIPVPDPAPPRRRAVRK